ncbi:hypothetical protein Tco_0306408, partial [Tanacetum coccineum]
EIEMEEMEMEEIEMEERIEMVMEKEEEMVITPEVLCMLLEKQLGLRPPMPWDRAYEVDDRGVLSKKRDSEDGNRVMELGCERK